jgi:hypothetical protein
MTSLHSYSSFIFRPSCAERPCWGSGVSSSSFLQLGPSPLRFYMVRRMQPTLVCDSSPSLEIILIDYERMAVWSFESSKENVMGQEPFRTTKINTPSVVLLTVELSPARIDNREHTCCCKQSDAFALIGCSIGCSWSSL